MLTFALVWQLELPFDSEEAQAINRLIFETIYFAALTCSKDLAMKNGPYPSYAVRHLPHRRRRRCCRVSDPSEGRSCSRVLRRPREYSSSTCGA